MGVYTTQGCVVPQSLSLAFLLIIPCVLVDYPLTFFKNPYCFHPLSLAFTSKVQGIILFLQGIMDRRRLGDDASLRREVTLRGCIHELGRVRLPGIQTMTNLFPKTPCTRALGAEPFQVRSHYCHLCICTHARVYII